MILCDHQIRKAVLDFKTLTINPFNESQLNPGSYNVRLGNWFVFVSSDGNGDPNYSDLRYYPDNARVLLPAGQTVLGMTKEIFGSNTDIVPQLRSRSTTRRTGITICDDAGYGDVGYINHWTVEMVAHHSSGYAAIVVGSEFAQAIFTQSCTPEKPYQGQYNANEWPLCMLPKKYRNLYQVYYKHMKSCAELNPGTPLSAKEVSLPSLMNFSKKTGEQP